jgi:GNAT superfamily N-acetyltransferase
LRELIDFKIVRPPKAGPPTPKACQSAQKAEPLPRYPLVPAALLGRLAADLRHRGKGCGRLLLADASFRSVRSEIASFAVLVDAKDEAARRFYERERFLSLSDQPMKRFRSMADIAKLFE